MANPAIVTAAAHLPLTLLEVKKQVQLDAEYTDEDDFLWSINQAATDAAETLLARQLVTTTLDYSLDDFPACNFIQLPGGRLVSISSLKYTTDDATETTWAASNYRASTTHEPGWLGFATTSISWPSVTLRPHDGIVIRYIVGYGTGDQVPESIRSALKLLVGHLYNNRETVVVGVGIAAIEIPETYKAMLMPYRLWSF